jgi:hypothetical protein
VKRMIRDLRALAAVELFGLAVRLDAPAVFEVVDLARKIDAEQRP